MIVITDVLKYRNFDLVDNEAKTNLDFLTINFVMKHFVCREALPSLGNVFGKINNFLHTLPTCLLGTNWIRKYSLNVG
jgi:hypothetical protein